MKIIIIKLICFILINSIKYFNSLYIVLYTKYHLYFFINKIIFYSLINIYYIFYIFCKMLNFCELTLFFIFIFFVLINFFYMLCLLLNRINFLKFLTINCIWSNLASSIWSIFWYYVEDRFNDTFSLYVFLIIIYIIIALCIIKKKISYDSLAKILIVHNCLAVLFFVLNMYLLNKKVKSYVHLSFYVSFYVFKFTYKCVMFISDVLFILKYDIVWHFINILFFIFKTDIENIVIFIIFILLFIAYYINNKK